ncbi:uncharacterized protein DUF1573 [Chitinophaga polysaccharea]|uniref:Uncharacterized protein DUF1573 n=1 Tax=Chitinophaga polysaccharea TaxID=1293035 RepID=A0A561PQL4_9BACT|nr:DUF1573 domain-containing protein [Chitinophaga polysaccharea]TWF40417.1 uncharacterized protein DUF1573 [Chitinophaga polysaccharea]
MKYILFISLLPLFFSCNNSPNKPQSNIPESKITFDMDTIHINRISVGDSITVVFRYKNSGEAPLKVINVAGSCSCTIPYHDSTPINPGKTGFIRVQYKNAADTSAIFKVVVVETNQTSAPLHSIYLVTN